MALRLPGRIKVHVEVDTGMYRVPLKPERAPDFIRLLHSFGVYEVEGNFFPFFFLSFPNDPVHREFTLKQLAIFKEVVRGCETNGHCFPLKHMASSGAVALYPEAYLDMIRPGYILYGFPADWIRLRTKPALSWKTRVWSVLPVAKGVGVGYDQDYIPQRDTKIAILATGLCRRYTRVLSNLSHVVIRGKRAPVVGLIGMDQMMADVGDIAGVSRGDEVVLIGEQEGEQVTAVELANHLNTTAAFITCSIAHRVERTYLNEIPDYRKNNNPLPSLVLVNGNFHTQDPARPRAKAAVIEGNRILAVGEDDEIKSLSRPNSKIIDLAGRLVLPGMTDSHIHFLLWALMRQALPLGSDFLRDGCRAGIPKSPIYTSWSMDYGNGAG